MELFCNVWDSPPFQFCSCTITCNKRMKVVLHAVMKTFDARGKVFTRH